MTRLERLQNVLIKKANSFYTAISEDLPLLEIEYASHYANLGRVIYTIRNYNTVGGLIDDLYDGQFSELGIGDNSDVDGLLNETFKLIY
jgi:hypothetical protein